MGLRPQLLDMCLELMLSLSRAIQSEDGLSPFSAGKGWGKSYRAGDGSLVLLATIL